MTIITVTSPAPACILPATHPARAHIPACKTDVRRTFAPHWPDHRLCDDYEHVERTDWLSNGEFK